MIHGRITAPYVNRSKPLRILHCSSPLDLARCRCNLGNFGCIWKRRRSASQVPVVSFSQYDHAVADYNHAAVRSIEIDSSFSYRLILDGCHAVVCYVVVVVLNAQDTAHWLDNWIAAYLFPIGLALISIRALQNSRASQYLLIVALSTPQCERSVCTRI